LERGFLGSHRKENAVRLKLPPDWNPPKNWRRVRTIDVHAAGEPLRILVDGFPDIPGDTIAEKRRFARLNHDSLRTELMWEPRGHADMYGCILTEPVTSGTDFGALFMHNEGWSTMCGHGIIAVTTVVLETGMLATKAPETVVRIDTPAGLVTATALIDDGHVSSVRFANVPSYVVAADQLVEVPGIGRVRYDLAFGGAYYAYVDAADFGLQCVSSEVGRLIDVGMQIKRAVMKAIGIVHPFDDSLGFLYGTIFIAPARSGEADSRNVCVFAEGEVDRSPTGTGVSGRLALHYARGEIGSGETHVVESIIGTCFAGRVIDETSFGCHEAVIPEVEGTAHITGMHTLCIDPHDPLAEGFLVR